MTEPTQRAARLARLMSRGAATGASEARATPHEAARRATQVLIGALLPGDVELQAALGGDLSALEHAQRPGPAQALLDALLDALEGPLSAPLAGWVELAEGGASDGALWRAVDTHLARPECLALRRALTSRWAALPSTRARLSALIDARPSLRGARGPLTGLLSAALSASESLRGSRLSEALRVEVYVSYRRFQRALLSDDLRSAGAALDDLFGYTPNRPALLISDAALCVLEGRPGEARRALSEALAFIHDHAALEAAYAALAAPPRLEKTAAAPRHSPRDLRPRLGIEGRAVRAEGRVYKPRLDRWSPRPSYARWVIEAVAAALGRAPEAIDAALTTLHRGEAYRAFTITAPSGKPRRIQAPQGALIEIQAAILEGLLYRLPVSNAAHGATPGRSLITQAVAHLPQPRQALSLDLKDAYPSVSFQRVYRVFYEGLARLLPVARLPGLEGLRPLVARDHLAHLLATLTCAPLQGARPKPKTAWALPQGAPTSAALLNLACADLDRGVYKLLRAHPGVDLRYTRYIDDLTITATGGALPEGLTRQLERLIERVGFSSQPLKRRAWRVGEGPLIICGLSLESGGVAFGPDLIARAATLSALGAPGAAELRGLAAFARQIYAQTPPFLQSWAEAAPARAWSSPRAPYLRYLQGDPTAAAPGVAQLARWLDAPMAQVERALALLEAGAAYATWRLSKGGGGEREIESPAAPLKGLQTRILHRLISRAPLSAAAHGFAEGRSIATNARAHLGAAALLNVDIEDAFPSVSAQRVRHALDRALGPRLASLGPSAEAASEALGLLTRLLTYRGRLPQGAPTSGALFNLCLTPLDRLLEDACGPRGITYTRYADDLTFSSPRVEAIDAAFGDQIKQIIHRAGFRWSARKWARMAAPRLEVCGVRLDGAHLRLSRAQLQRYRATLHRLAHAPTLDAEGRDKAAGILGFVHMIYGELPAPLRGPAQALRQRHRLEPKPKSKLDLYGRG